MLLQRRYDKEIMDDFSITDGRITKALDELRTINTVLGGSRTSIAGIRELVSPGSPVLVLDVGAGGSDHLTQGALRGTALEIVSVDINTGVCRYIKEHDPSRSIVCADAHALPFRENSFDIVHVSLFLHHFTEAEIERLLRAFLGIARCGVVVNDLQRSAFALWGITILTRLFSRSAMVKNDGPLSVRRGFRRAEMAALLGTLDGASFTLRWRWAFRWLAVVTKDRAN